MANRRKYQSPNPDYIVVKMDGPVKRRLELLRFQLGKGASFQSIAYEGILRMLDIHKIPETVERAA